MNGTDLRPHSTELRLTMHDLVARTIEVEAVADLSPQMKRVTFRITEPDGFHFVHMAPDDHVKLFFAHPDTGRVEMPQTGSDGMQLPTEGPFPIYRDYTVRAFDRAAGLLDIDFVVHTHGVAGSWAATATRGDRLGMLGPRGSHIYPTGYDAYLLGADDTAIPALARWLEELPADKRVIAFVEVSGPDAEVELPDRPSTTVHVLHRGDAAPGNSTLLYDAIRSHEMPAGEFYCWVAGEANSLKPIRRYLRRELGLPKNRVKVDGYWRSGTVNLDHHEADGDD
ncbi:MULTISPECIES: siderophore-interacting protein [unclassified Gordonia (in: high G+C Gram-positive bacteria)]|uniref:siderophore-interacting protein n=1 Tax=unclassified Gordonia (in: high G+C Gram-positive bacteria) TaxID=2657482 RepID=UPI001F0DC145|nr:siderophore-interacting protein [Gordonia sp. ABSL49_1]MCH5642829.1 siderophore-interacting protein [Gordonia sp. ABSL49_1]